MFNSKLIISSLLLTLMLPLSTIVKAESSKTAPATPSQPTTDKKTISQQLLGEWETKDSNSGQVLKFLFTPDNKLFFILPAPDKSMVAIPMMYKINPGFQPMQVDISINNDETVLTIFEITTDGKLRMQIEGTKPNEIRPNNFSTKATLFTKISEETIVPKNVQVLKLEPTTNKPRINIAVQYITIFNQAQQDFYQKNGKFASTATELALITNSETEFYRYKIIPAGDGTQNVMMTAQAKDSKHPSYTGVVFARTIKDKISTVTGICETNQPSTTAPEMLKPPIGDDSSVIQCPSGSHLFVPK